MGRKTRLFAIILCLSTLLCLIFLSAQLTSGQSRVDCMASIDNSAALNVEGVRVYKAARNQLLEPRDQCYFIPPSFYLKSSDGRKPKMDVNKYGDLVKVNFAIVLVYPNREKVVHGLHEINPEVRAANVGYLTPQNIEVESDLFNTRDLLGEKKESINPPLTTRVIPISLTARPEYRRYIESYVNNFLAGTEQLTLRVKFKEVEVRLRYAAVTYDMIYNSEPYREYSEKAKDKYVFATSIYLLAFDILRYFDAVYWDEFLEGDETQFIQAGNEMVSKLTAVHEKTFLDVNQIYSMIAPYRVDLSSERFQPSYITEFHEDVTNLTEAEFSKKYEEEFYKHFKSLDSLRWGGSGGFKLFGIFDLGGEAAKTKKKMRDDELRKWLHDENFFRTKIDRSFKRDVKGKIILPLQVEVYENISANIKIKGKETVTQVRVSDNPGWVTISLDASRIKIPDSLEDLPGPEPVDWW